MSKRWAINCSFGIQGEGPDYATAYSVVDFRILFAVILVGSTRVTLAEVGDALRERDAPRLRQAAPRFCALLFVFSTVAGNVASDLEDHAAQGQLEEARPLVERLDTMTQELMWLVGGLSLSALREQAGAAYDAQGIAEW